MVTVAMALFVKVFSVLHISSILLPVCLGVELLFTEWVQLAKLTNVNNQHCAWAGK